VSLGFWELPGPSAFAAEVEDVVRRGESAAILLPPGTPGGLGSYLGARARGDACLWVSVSPGDAEPATALSDLVAMPAPAAGRAARALAEALRRTTVWIEGVPPERLRSWTGLLSQFAAAARSETAGSAGALALVGEPAGVQAREEVGLRVLRWKGRVRREDALIHLADLPGGEGGSAESQLRVALAVELAGWDLDLARRLAERSLTELLRPAALLRHEASERGWRLPAPRDRWAAGWSDCWRGSQLDHPAALALEGREQELAQRVWKAEIAVLFPLIEERRCALLSQLRPFLKAPVDTPVGRIESVEDLEIGQIWHQVRCSRLNEATRRRVMGLANMRRALAHVEPIDPEDLCNAGLVDRAAIAAA
jgi:hypothetical protein